MDIIVLALIVALLGFLSFIGYKLVKYGETLAESKSNDAELKKAVETRKVASHVATNTPVTDDDVIDRL